jgi:hypothetical protein
VDFGNLPFLILHLGIFRQYAFRKVYIRIAIWTLDNKVRYPDNVLSLESQHFKDKARRIFLQFQNVRPSPFRENTLFPEIQIALLVGNRMKTLLYNIKLFSGFKQCTYHVCR